MNLVIFKYGLPLLLSYILFMGISGRLNPFRKPVALAERPAWLLGVWTALSVTLVLGVGLHMAYGMALESARTLFKPSALLLGGLLIPGFVAYFLYRRSIENELDQAARLSMADNIDTCLSTDLVMELDDEVIEDIFVEDEFTEEDIEAAIEATVQETAGEALDSSETAKVEAATFNNPELQYIAHITPDHVVDKDEMQQSSAPLDALEEVFDDEVVENIFTEEELDAGIEGTEQETASEALDLSETVEVDVTTADSSEPQATTPLTTVDATEVDEMQQLTASRIALEEEQTLREEAEKHLVIMRKAMSRLDAETREYETSKADAIIQLEEELEASVKQVSAAESRATRAEERRINADDQIVDLKKNLATAKQELRLSTTARAKALGTANKSVAFARQSIQQRQRLENDVSRLESQVTHLQNSLQSTRDALQKRQSTVASLIKALETEKLRSRANMSKMAKHMVLKDRQQRARKSRETLARNVEDNLTSRLVKKVAKARPLASDS